MTIVEARVFGANLARQLGFSWGDVARVYRSTVADILNDVESATGTRPEPDPEPPPKPGRRWPRNAKLSRDDLLDMAAMARAGKSPKDAASVFGVRPSYARSIMEGRRYSAVTGIGRPPATS
jgi:hypothetical protein